MKEIIEELDRLKEALAEEQDCIDYYKVETEQDYESREDAWSYICDAVESIEAAIDCLKEVKE